MENILDLMIDILSPIINSEEFDLLSRLCLNQGFEIFENPRRKGNQIPSLVLEEGVVLLLHGRFPKGISSNLTIKLWM
jgi:hypothetical protein